MSNETVRFGDLAGTLHLPSGPGPHPAVVALHPADGPSRDHFLFRHLARILPPIGVAVLLFDRRPGAKDHFDQQCADALAAVAALRGRAEIDPARIGLWGYSQGAWVAPLAAARSPAVAFLVLIAACGVSPAEQMRYGTAIHLRREGYGPEAVERMLATRTVWESFERGTMSRRAAQAAIDGVRGEPWFSLAFVPPVLPPGPGRWPTMDFDPVPILAGIRVPVLAFYGDEDEWVPVEPSVAAWERAGLSDLSIVRLANVGHAPTREDSEELEAIVPEYTDALRSWLVRRVVKASSCS